MSGKSVAFDVLKEANQPLHFKKIVEIALKHGWLKSAGRAPAQTLYTELLREINKNGSKSAFKRIEPGIFGLNPAYKGKIYAEEELNLKKIGTDISTQQKGGIAEARIAELIMLYGKSSLVCYKPVADNEGIDLIVKEKNTVNPKTVYLQIKSNYRINPNVFSATVKAGPQIDKNNHQMAVVFCRYNLVQAEIDALWFVPVPVLVNRLSPNRKKQYVFVAGIKQMMRDGKWNDLLADKMDLSDRVLALMNKK